MKLFLAGDVMLGRGIDQCLPFPNDPVLFESWSSDARDYVRLAERIHGPIKKPMRFSDPWGETLHLLEEEKPDVRFINLETAVTQASLPYPAKEVHYRMNPRNIKTLLEAKIDACSLANNHILDWQLVGLQETLNTLHRFHVRTAGAGSNLNESKAPAILEVPQQGRVLLFSVANPSSGVPLDWQASESRPGIFLLSDLSRDSAEKMAMETRKQRISGDIAILSIHWGSNWGYEIPERERLFAHALIDTGGIDLIHGHSSHHVKGIEIYKDKLILYGCGDLINDYEGISSSPEYRNDLVLLYLPTLAKNGQLMQLDLFVFHPVRFSLQKASKRDSLWLTERLNRESTKLGAIFHCNSRAKITWHRPC